MKIWFNAQAVKNIFIKMLCNTASKESREAKKIVLEKIKEKDSTLASVCVPEYVYRWFNPELIFYGFKYTNQYKAQLDEYCNDDS